MFKKKLIAVTAMALALTVIPAVPASAASAVSGAAITVKSMTSNKKSAKKSTYKPVNAKNLTSSYKKKLARQRKNNISVTPGNYKSRVKKEQNALIGLNWQELKQNSQIRISEKSFDLMCRVVQCEAGNVKYTTKELTAEVIVNRARSYKTSDPVYSALTAKNQFTVVKSSRINRIDINGETVNAVKDALVKNSHPKSLKFFRAGYYFSWARPYTHADGTYFSLA